LLVSFFYWAKGEQRTQRSVKINQVVTLIMVFKLKSCNKLSESSGPWMGRRPRAPSIRRSGL